MKVEEKEVVLKIDGQNTVVARYNLNTFESIDEVKDHLGDDAILTLVNRHYGLEAKKVAKASYEQGRDVQVAVDALTPGRVKKEASLRNIELALEEMENRRMWSEFDRVERLLNSEGVTAAFNYAQEVL